MSTLETRDDPENGNYAYYGYYCIAIMRIIAIISIVPYGLDRLVVGLFESVGSRLLYDLDYKRTILNAVPIQSILGKLPLLPVGETGTIPHRMHNTFPPGAPGDRRPGAGDGCRMWFVNSWALGWSRDLQ